jgi:hypothetical protein
MNEIFDYFEEVPSANAKAAIANRGDRRLAINAIMTLDGFLGTLHSQLFKLKIISEKSDDKWKETLARSCHHYRVLRDTAYALKHGTLDRSPRLVKRSDQVVTMPGGFQSDAFQSGAFQKETVWIEASDTDYEASDVIKPFLN